MGIAAVHGKTWTIRRVSRKVADADGSDNLSKAEFLAEAESLFFTPLNSVCREMQSAMLRVSDSCQFLEAQLISSKPSVQERLQGLKREDLSAEADTHTSSNARHICTAVPIVFVGHALPQVTLFQDYDLNGDGSVSREEFGAAEELPAISAADFKARVLAEYGSVDGAWEHVLNVTGGEDLTPAHFAEWAKSLGYSNGEELYAQLSRSEHYAESVRIN